MTMHEDPFFSTFGGAFIETLCTVSPDIVFVKDLDGAFLFANQAFENLYGYTLEQIRGKTDAQFMSEEETAYFLQKDREALMAQSPVVSIAWQTNPMTGQEVCYETIKSPIRNEAGTVIGLLGIGRDVTQRERAEAALQSLNRELEERIAQRTQALEASNGELQLALDRLQLTQNELVQGERLASLGRLVAGLAHELNTPIGSAAIVGATLGEDARSVLQAIEDGSIRKSTLTRFVRSVSEGASLINTTLSHANELIASFKQVGVDQASLHRRPFDLAETVQDILRALAVSFKGSGVVLKSDVPAGLRMDSYPGMVTQVLINLAENARLHAFDGPGDKWVDIRAREAGGDVELTVRDNGSGIAPEIQDQVFAPFFTTKKGSGGSGLGLSIVHSLVTQGLGGDIRLESVPGSGSSFLIRIPKVAA